MNNNIKNNAIKALIIEDSFQDAELMVAQLGEAGYQLDVIHAENEAQLITALEKNNFDIVLSDFKLLGFDAFGALELCQKLCPEVPFICVSGSIGEELAIDLLKKGAVDYVLKDRPERLPYAVQNAIESAKEKAARIKADIELMENYNLIRIAGEKAKLGGWSVNLEDNICNWSNEVAAIHEMPIGYSPLVEEGINFYAPEWRNKIKEVFGKCAQEGISYDEEMEIITATGKRVRVNTIGEAVRNKDGKIVQVQGAFQDITTRKQSEEIIKQDKEHLNNFFKQSLTGFFIMMIDEPITWNDTIDKEKVLNYVFEHQHFVKVNQAMLDQYKASEPDFMNKTPNELFAHQIKEGRDIWKELFNKGSLHTITFEKRFDGSDMWIEGDYICLYDSLGRISGHFGNQMDITQRKQAENELLKSKTNLEEYFENDISADYVVSVSGEIFSCNPTFLNLFGFEKKSDTEKFDITGLYKNPEDRTQLLRLVKKHGKVENYEVEYISNNGKLINAIINAIGIFNEEGDLEKTRGYIVDITEHKRVQLEYKTMVKASRDGFLIIDAQTGKFIDANQSYCEMIGYSREELLQMTIPDVEAIENQKETELHIEQIIEKGYESFESKHKTKSGSIIDIEASVTFIVSDIHKFFVFIKDISERKRRQKEISKLSHAVEQSPTSVIITDLDGNIEYANPNTLKITGYTKEDLIGKRTSIFSSGEKPKSEYKALWETILSGNEWRGEFHNKKKSGELYWELASISPIINEKGETINFLSVKEDITERKQILDDLIIAKEHAEQSDKLKSAFLANMSHEIRTPMNGILGFAALLKEPGLSGEKQQKYIKVIEKSGERMLNIINDIVDISKIESGTMKIYITETDVNEKIENLYHFFTPQAEAKKIQFSVKNTLPKNDAIIKTDSEKLYAILSNLLKNAIKFTNEGKIAFGVAYTGSSNGQKQLKFFVKDTGMGIPKERQEAIFERFIQADIYDKMALQGAGLGLSIAKAYVELLGGKIWVESEEGIGSVFYFTIPYNNEMDKVFIQDADESTKADEKAGNLKILIADDDEGSQMLLSTIVEKYASEIFIANDGMEAVEIYKNNPDIDLILMDIQMPNLNGYEATKQIRQLNKNVVIIAQTAYALSYDRQKVIDAGCNDYISKPILINDLKSLIRKYFEE